MKLMTALPYADLAVFSVTGPTFGENHTTFEMPEWTVSVRANRPYGVVFHGRRSSTRLIL